jgi:hypothetical protein
VPLAIDDFYPVLGRKESGELVRLIGELDHFRGTWRKMQAIRADRLVQLRQVTTIESTASSTRIEGVELTDAEVALVLEGITLRFISSARRAGGEGLCGTADSHLRVIYRDRADRESRQQLHRVLLAHSSKDERRRGEYKKLPNDVVRKRGAVVEEVVFQTATPFDTPRLMREVIDVTNAALADPALHPLVVIARFVVDCLAIHPFQDGNGRLTDRAARYHLDVLRSRGIVAAHGKKRGAYYTLTSSKSESTKAPSILGGTNVIIAEIHERGGRISKDDLVALVRSHG